MSEPDSPTRGDLHHQHHHHQQQQQQLHQSSSQHNADERDDANSSIIGKVKSRVSSIFPQTLTKWFSPSTTPTTAATASNGGVSRRRRRNDECEDEEYERANNSDDDSNNSAEDEDDISPAPVQPPTKRSRLNVEVSRTNFKENRSFSSSTPTTAVRRRTTTTTHLNLYGKKKEPAYNFTQTKITTNTTRSGTTKNSTIDSADIIEVVPERNLNTSISSRRSLNIPSTSFSEGYRSLRDLKHQPALNLRTAIVSGPPSVSSRMQQQRAGAKILEAADDDEEDDEEDEGQVARSSTIVVEEVDEDEDAEDDNEESEEIAKVTSKKQKFTNGNLVGRSSSVATESGESRSSSVQAGPAKSGMFNPASRGLRTLSGNGLNFYSHLEGRKSLFSEKNMPGMLNNSTLSLTSLNRRQFNSSIYGSTSALSDSRLLNTSSPFYKGQTTYGGAAAYNTFNRSLNQSVRIAPTLIRPTSSLSTLSSSSNSLAQGTDQSNSTISSTAKRILELINDFSTPLNDAKKMASNIKTPAMWANSSAAGKRFSEADLATSRSVRLSTVRTPYFRPTVTLNPSNNDSKKILPPLKELHVPSMSQLLQMKKMLSCTERSRQIAATSKSALNQECEYKLPGEDEAACEKASNKHVSKIRNKVTTTSRVSSKNANLQDEEAPAPANLPNVAFPFMHSVPKIDIPLKSNLPAAAEKKDSTAASSKKAKPTFAFGTVSKLIEEPKPTLANAKPAVNFNVGSGASKKPVASSNEFKFSSPLNMNHIPLKEDLTPINNFKFSSPVLVDKQNDIGKAAPAAAPVSSSKPQLKTGSVLDALKNTSQTPAATPLLLETTVSTAQFKPAGASLFGAQFKKPSNEWECDACMVRNKDTADCCVACTTPRKKTTAATTTPALPSFSAPLKNSFGDAFKPKSDTWECSACMVRNKNDVTECVACNTKKPGATAAPAAKLQTTDVGFKSLVAQQTASKWECDACMTRNDAERNKCVCCEQAKPGTQTVTDSVPKFSFGTSSASKFTFGFGNAGAKKEDELKAEASKTENKTGFTFGIPAKTESGSTGSTTAPATSTGISFGVSPITNSTSSASTGKDVPDVVKTNMTGFKFGVPPADSSKSESAAVTTTTAPAGFSFGIKQDAKTSSVKFNLPTTAAENKATPTSATLTSSSSSSTVTTSLFGTATTSAFGAAPDVVESKSTSADPNKVLKSIVFAVPAPVSSSANAPTQETKGFVFGVPAPVSSSAPAATTNAIKPLTFGSSSTSEANKSSPQMTFGSPATSSATSAANTTASSSLFGKSISTTATFSKSPSSISGFAFGKEQSSAAPGLFGSQTASSTSADTKSTTLIFGTTAAPSSAATTVSSSAAPFVFGKPSITSTTPSFGGITASTTSMTTSVFGSKPSSVFSGVSAPSSSTSNSGVSSTLATNPAPTTTASSTPFVFGRDTASSSSQNNKPLFGSSPFESGSSAAPATATSSWPTNTFTFGSSKPAEEAKSAAMPAPAFGSPARIFGSATPMFGSAQVNEVKPTQSAPTAVPTFGASATTSLFGSNSTSASSVSGQQATGNLFGSTTSTPLFGSMTFGAAPAAAAAPVAQASSNPSTGATFGSGDSSFFSGFGSLAAASPSSTSDGASAPKKAELAFNFGGSQNSGNGGFSFGSNNNNKPADTAFKFTASGAPSFNFTGSSETANAAQPFQFGAPTGTPAVFNFGSVEAAANTGISGVQSTSSSKNADNKSPFNTTVDHSAITRQWLRPIRDDKNNNKNTYINANAISSDSSSSSSISSSIKKKSSSTSSTQASTIAAFCTNQTNPDELSNHFSLPAPQQKPYHFKKQFLMQKYKFYRISEETEQQCKNLNSNSNRISKVSDGNGGDDDHHDPKDDIQINDDKSLAPDDNNTEQHQHKHQQHSQTNADYGEYLPTDNIKTADELTETNSSNLLTKQNTYINSNPQQERINREGISQGINDGHHDRVRHTRNHPQVYKKFTLTNTNGGKNSSNLSKYTLVRKRTTSSSSSTGASGAMTKKILRIPPKHFIARRPTRRSSNTNTTTTTTATVASYRDPAKYKYVKKSPEN